MKKNLKADREAPLSNSLYLYQCGEEQCVPGHNFGPAVRDHYLIHCILSGKGMFYKEGRTYGLSAGNGFLIVPNEKTTYTADWEEPWNYCWVGFHGKEAKHILEICGIGIGEPIFSFSDIFALHSCVQNLMQYSAVGGNVFRSMEMLYRFFALICQDGYQKRQTSWMNIAERAADYMEKNHSYGIEILDVARYVGLDRSQLFRCFKKEYRMSPQEYLIRCRITHAKQLLLQTDLSVSEVMYSSGFNDLPNFSRQFKKATGYSPAAYRKYKLVADQSSSNSSESFNSSIFRS